MKRIREYLNENVPLPRKAIIFFLVAIIVTASILFVRMYRKKNNDKETFLIQTSIQLHDMEYCIEKLLEPDLTMEEVEYYCTGFQRAITSFNTVMMDGYYFAQIDSYISYRSGAGFDGVRIALEGITVYDKDYVSEPLEIQQNVVIGRGTVAVSNDVNYKIPPLANGGITQNERLFLQKLLPVVKKLMEPQQRCSDGTATTASSLRVFLRAFSSFEKEWQVEGRLTPSGVSPFDCLKESE